MIAIVVILVSALSCLALAAPNEGQVPPPSPPDFRVFVERFNLPEEGEVFGCGIITGKKKFSFVPPAGWLQENNLADQKVTFTRRDFSAVISLKIWRTNFPPDLKALVLEQFPEAKIARQFPCHSGAQPGAGFDLERAFTKKPSLNTRLAFLAVPNSGLEIQVTTTPDKFRKYHAVFGQLLNSLQIDDWPPVRPAAAGGL